MTTQYYTTVNSEGKLVLSHYSVSASNKVNGRVVLAQTPYVLDHVKANVLYRSPSGEGYWPKDAILEDVTPTPAREHAINVARAKFRGKLHKGGASIGVTLASWRQSRQMITDRIKSIDDLFGRKLERFADNRSLRQKLASGGRKTAGTFLEGEFGWVPLVKDIHAALTTVCGSDAIPPEFMRGSHKVVVNQRDPPFVGDPVKGYIRIEGWVRATVVSTVSINNPNLWLLNRLGLINLPGVAWDLVPWSFVANMFGNFNAIIGSVTDFVGLDLSNESVTLTSSLMRSERIERPEFGQVGESQLFYKHKDRSVGSIPNPSFETKVPNVDWELAAIASALLVQKVSAISKLFR